MKRMIVGILEFLCCLAGVFPCFALENFLEFPGGVRVLYWSRRPLEAGSETAEYAVVFVHGLSKRTKDLTPGLKKLIRQDPRAGKVVFVQPAFVTEKSCPPKFQGKIAAFVDSCANMSNYTKFMNEGGYELGVAPYPTYDKDNRAVTLGGGNLVLVDCGNSEEQKKAGWEFMQYLMTDERIAKEAIGSGYLPVTKSVANSELMKAYWEEKPNFKVAYDELIEYGTCQEMPFVLYRNEYGANCESACSLLIQEGSITPEEAVEMIRVNAEYLKK